MNYRVRFSSLHDIDSIQRGVIVADTAEQARMMFVVGGCEVLEVEEVHSIEQATALEALPMSEQVAAEVAEDNKWLENNCPKCGGSGRGEPTLQDPDGAEEMCAFCGKLRIHSDTVSESLPHTNANGNLQWQGVEFDMPAIVERTQEYSAGLKAQIDARTAAVKSLNAQAAKNVRLGVKR